MKIYLISSWLQVLGKKKFSKHLFKKPYFMFSIDGFNLTSKWSIRNICFLLTKTFHSYSKRTFSPNLPSSPFNPGFPLLPASPLLPGNPIWPGFPLKPGGPTSPCSPVSPRGPTSPRLPWNNKKVKRKKKTSLLNLPKLLSKQKSFDCKLKK